MPEGIDAGVTTESVGGASQAAESPAASQSSGALNEQSSADVKTQPVQGETTTQTQTDDPLAGFPSDDELQTAVAGKVPWAEMAARLKGAYEPLKTNFSDLQTKYQPYESILGRFEQPNQLQESIDLADNLIAWEQGPNGLEPATQKGAELIAQRFPLHADHLSADLLNMETVDPATGQRMTRLDVALSAMAEVPAERAKVAKMFGLVEPSSISPQWQPSEEELARLYVDPSNPTADEKALTSIYSKLPYEERMELKLNSPDYVTSQLKKEKLLQDLAANKTQTDAREAQRVQQREQYVAQQANQAGEQYVTSQLTDALTTFHNSVVEQCNFISPLDPANLPQGMTPDQATQMNQQIAQSNKAEASMITGLTVALFNPEVRPFVEPLLREIGVIDEKLIKELDAAADGFGNNGRNFGHLSYRGKMQANGNGYQPDASVTRLSNESGRNLKLMVHIANQVKSRLMEKRSQFFQMKATDHNQTLNNVAASRPSPNGVTYDPATAAAQRPSGWMSRDDIARQFS